MKTFFFLREKILKSEHTETIQNEFTIMIYGILGAEIHS